MAVFRNESMQKTIMAQKQTEALLSYSSDKRKTEQHCDKRNNLGVVAKESSHLYHYFILRSKIGAKDNHLKKNKQIHFFLILMTTVKQNNMVKKEQRWNCHKGIISSLPLYIFGKQTDAKDNPGKEKFIAFFFLCQHETVQHGGKRNNVGMVAYESSHLYNYFMIDFF